MSSETEIRPFRVGMPDEAIVDLRQRIAATRWPSKELVADRSQGVQLTTMKELARYWTKDMIGAGLNRLNALPQFNTQIAGQTSISSTSLAAPGRLTGDHYAWLARLGH